MKYSFYIIGITLLAACNSGDKKVDELSNFSEKKSQHSDLFNASFEKVLNNYLTLKDALVAGDTAKANTSTGQLIKAADSLSLDELRKTDTSNIIIPTAKSYTSTISSEGKGLLGEHDIEAKRKEFQMISGALFDLVRTIRYDKQKLYLLNCPMAFDQQGADWLSNSSDIKNPYFGDKMLDCGNVKDSIDFK